MPVVDNLPDLSHWETVQEFSISQAAMLLAGVDPYDFDGGLDEVKDRGHERWKMAWGLSDGIVSAIRRGALEPIRCVAKEWHTYNSFGDGEWAYFDIEDLGNLDNQICKDRTIIRRDFLSAWVKGESVGCIQGLFKDEVVFSKNTSKNVYKLADNSSLFDERYEHKSEGLEYVKDVIHQFWSTYDVDNQQTAPTKKDVVKYLTERGAGKNIADAVDLILRPFALRGIGRRPKKDN